MKYKNIKYDQHFLNYFPSTYFSHTVLDNNKNVYQFNCLNYNLLLRTENIITFVTIKSIIIKITIDKVRSGSGCKIDKTKPYFLAPL